MKKILDFIEEKTYGKSYKSFQYCFEKIEVPKLDYEDKQNILIKRKGETDTSLKTSKSIKELAEKVAGKPLFKYFLDGSRRTYKVDDIAYDKKLYPIIAGQIGVGICYRENIDSFKAFSLNNPLVISLPANANSESSNDDLFFNNLIEKLNKQDLLVKQGIKFNTILPYSHSALKNNDKYEDRGVAKIQDEMVDLEKRVVLQLVKQKKLNRKTYLIKDGSLEYQKMKSGDLKDLSTIKTNYASVVGVSKAFNPEALSKEQKNISRIIADLRLFHRTPAFMYSTDRVENVKFAVWYLRIRDKKYTDSPFDGVLKLEKILVWENEEENGLNSDEIDLISANIINERNPVCYGQDNRWAKHLYPVFLTEKYIKSKYLSDTHFVNLF